MFPSILPRRSTNREHTQLEPVFLGDATHAIHRLKPGHPPTNTQSPTISFRKLADALSTTRTNSAVELVATNLLPDRTVRLFLTHAPTIDPEAIDRAIDPAICRTIDDPDVSADLDVARQYHSPTESQVTRTESRATPLAIETPLDPASTPIDLPPLLDTLASTDRPTSLRFRIERSQTRLGRLRSTTRTLFPGSTPHQPRTLEVGARAIALTPPEETAAATATLDAVLDPISTDAATRTTIDPRTRPTPATAEIDARDTHLPDLAVGTATDWVDHDLAGTASTIESIPPTVRDHRPPDQPALPLGAPVDHAGRPGPTDYYQPTPPPHTRVRYTIHHRDHGAFRAAIAASLDQPDPTIVLDGSGVATPGIAATHRATTDRPLTVLVGDAPETVTDREYRWLCTHYEGTLLVDPTDCPDPQAIGQRLVTALVDVTENLPNLTPTIFVTAPLAVTTYPPVARLLTGDLPITVELRIPVPHRQSVFGPPEVGPVRRAWYRLCSRHAETVLTTRLPTTLDPAARRALTPPTADPERFGERATTIGRDHWLVHGPGGPERPPGSVVVHAPPAPPDLEALPAHDRRRLQRRLAQHRQAGITPDIDLPEIPVTASEAAAERDATTAAGEAPAVSMFQADPDPAPSATDTADLEDAPEPSSAREAGPGSDPGAHPESTAPASDPTPPTPVPTTTLPYTDRFPDCLSYDPARHLVECSVCESRYAPTLDGIERAITCCHDRARVDREDIPTVDAHLKLTAEERSAIAYSDGQLVFLKLLANVRFRRYDPDVEFDLARDSMILLRDYAGLDAAAVDQLIADGLVYDQGMHPHQLYSITDDGRDLINESLRFGVSVGDGLGDLGESTEHVLMVDLLERYIDQEYVADPDYPATRVRCYHDHEGHRFDVAALDADGAIVIVGEAERDSGTYGAVKDYDQMAACDPDEAIWAVPSHAEGHAAVLDPLYDPPEGEPRITSTYSESTRMQKVMIDRPGLTQIKTISSLLSALNVK